MCAMISAYALARSVAKARADAKALAVREQLAMDSYRLMEQQLRETAGLRHEAKHQLTALDALYRKGDMAALGEELAQLTSDCAARQPAVFTMNFVINAILQSIAAQAEAAGVHFEAVALTPEELNIPDRDLCSFMMNMLDNALEASRQVAEPEKRFIRFRAELNGDFLVFRCENAYCEPLRLDARGWPQTTKPSPEAHGFGMRQMRGIAEKYGSILDFSYTGSSFSVQSALCLS